MPILMIKKIFEELSKIDDLELNLECNKVLKFINSYEKIFWNKKKKFIKYLNDFLDKKLKIHKNIIILIKSQLRIFELGEYTLSSYGEIERKNRSRNIITLEIKNARFLQTYVKIEEINNKKKYMSEMRYYYNFFHKESLDLEKVLENMPLTVPVFVYFIKGTNLFFVNNGVHTIFTMSKHNFNVIECSFEGFIENNKNFITLDEIKPE